METPKSNTPLTDALAALEKAKEEVKAIRADSGADRKKKKEARTASNQLAMIAAAQNATEKADRAKAIATKAGIIAAKAKAWAEKATDRATAANNKAEAASTRVTLSRLTTAENAKKAA